MHLEFDHDTLRALVRPIVSEILEQAASDEARLGNGRLAFTEQEAAQLLGIPRHSLRDLRLKGSVRASKLGARIVYSREQLADLLAQNEID